MKSITVFPYKCFFLTDDGRDSDSHYTWSESAPSSANSDGLIPELDSQGQGSCLTNGTWSSPGLLSLSVWRVYRD